MIVDSSARNFFNSNDYIFQAAAEAAAVLFHPDDVNNLMDQLEVYGGTGFACDFPDQPGETRYILYVPDGFLMELETKEARLAAVIHELLHLLVAWMFPSGACYMTDAEHEAVARAGELLLAQDLENSMQENPKLQDREMTDLLQVLRDRGSRFPKHEDDMAYMLTYIAYGDNLQERWFDLVTHVTVSAQHRALQRGY